MTQLQSLQKEIRDLANPERAKASEWFFKTKEGQYGHGDRFLGLTVPVQRVIAKKYVTLPLKDVEILLSSKFHEDRLIALFILVYQFEKLKEQAEKKIIFDFYLSNRKYVNNWDLVDSSAHKIVGAYLFDYSNKQIDILKKYALSENLWEKRIAMISTAAFINKGSSKETFEIASLLLNDKHDLIHKAVGWMLREVGKRVSREAEVTFLKKHYKTMPRTMLRYAIEHFSDEERKAYLLGKV